MHILLKILIVIVAIIALLFVAALIMKKDYSIKRSVEIHSSTAKAYEFIRHLKNQDKFNKWAKADPNRHWEYKGEDGNVGFIISWNGNKDAGEGEKEILKLVENKRVETEIRFVRPMKMNTQIIFEFDSIGENQCMVSMINQGRMDVPMNLFIPIGEKKFPADMDESLNTLKQVLEAE